MNEEHRHYKVAPEPLSKEAREKLTAGRDKMIKDATDKPKPDRLLADEEIHRLYLYIKDPFIPRYLDTGRETAKAQDAKTASIMRAECQARVERIFKEIENPYLDYQTNGTEVIARANRDSAIYDEAIQEARRKVRDG